MLKSKEIAKLKYIAHSSDINKYIIGKDLIKESSLNMLDDALEANELIKVSLLKTVSLSIDEAVEIIVENLSCTLVQKIGRTMVLYRESNKNKKVTNQLHGR